MDHDLSTITESSSANGGLGDEFRGQIGAERGGGTAKHKSKPDARHHNHCLEHIRTKVLIYKPFFNLVRDRTGDIRWRKITFGPRYRSVNWRLTKGKETLTCQGVQVWNTRPATAVFPVQLGIGQRRAARISPGLVRGRTRRHSVAPQ